MQKANAVNPFYFGVDNDHPLLVVVVHLGEERVVKSIFEEARELIETGGHIWRSIVMSS